MDLLFAIIINNMAELQPSSKRGLLNDADVEDDSTAFWFDKGRNDTNAVVSRVHTDQQQQLQQRRSILLVEGWSPGPLSFLQRRLQQRTMTMDARKKNHNESRHNNSSHYYNVWHLSQSLPMPPLPIGSWWKSPSIWMMLVIGLIGWYAICKWNPPFPYILRWILILAFLVAWLRGSAAVVVRSSVTKGVALLRKELVQHDEHSKQPVDLIIAFSWGAAIVSELLLEEQERQQQQQQQQQGNHQGSPSLLAHTCILLIAPTTARIAQLAGNTDAAIRLTQKHQQHNCAFPLPTVARIHIVHATHDGFFCPHVDRWEELALMSNHNATARRRTESMPPLPLQHHLQCGSSSSSSSSSSPPPDISFTLLHDNHVFQSPSSLRALEEIMMGLLLQTPPARHGCVDEHASHINVDPVQ